MSQAETRIDRDRQALVEAQDQGGSAVFKTYFRLSGPGWLQSAITLGSGSLAGALFLGVLGGTSLLWLQLVAIVMGVIMLSAISYVTLSTGERPFRAINQHINPVLGWGWLIATCMANMIWCMPQFSVSFAALQKNLSPRHTVGDTTWQYKNCSFGAILFSCGPGGRAAQWSTGCSCESFRRACLSRFSGYDRPLFFWCSGLSEPRWSS